MLWACNLLRNLPVPEYGEHIKFQFICYCIELLIPINYKVWKSLICQVRLLPNRFAIEFHAVDCCFFWLHLWVYDKAHGFNRYSRETVTIEVMMVSIRICRKRFLVSSNSSVLSRVLFSTNATQPLQWIHFSGTSPRDYL